MEMSRQVAGAAVAAAALTENDRRDEQTVL
jgi:hypothetical protein